MANYIDIDDLRDYMVDDDDLPAADDTAGLARLNKVIRRACRQIDNLIIWDGKTDTENGLKVLVSDIRKPQYLAQLKNIVCAQTEYRLHMGEDFFKQDQYDKTRGPVFATEGMLSYIAPAVWEELDGSFWSSVIDGMTSGSSGDRHLLIDNINGDDSLYLDNDGHLN